MKKLDNLTIAKRKFNSRLIVGTGKYKNMSECAKAVKLSGAEIVTVAVRRVNIVDKKKPLLMDYIDPKKITYLPNTAGCFSSEEALRTLRLAREIGDWRYTQQVGEDSYAQDWCYSKERTGSSNSEFIGGSRRKKTVQQFNNYNTIECTVEEW